jgi:hypothetical protein
LPNKLKTLNSNPSTKERKSCKRKVEAPHKGKPIRITSDFSTKILKARREWSDVFQALKDNNSQPKLLYPLAEWLKQ